MPREEPANPLTLAVANLSRADVIPWDDLLRMYYRRILELTKGAIYGKHGAGTLLGMSGEKLNYWLKKFGLK